MIVLIRIFSHDLQTVVYQHNILSQAYYSTNPSTAQLIIYLSDAPIALQLHHYISIDITMRSPHITMQARCILLTTQQLMAREPYIDN